MAQLKDLLVEGQSRMVGYLYATSDIFEKGTALEDKYGATLSISGTSLSLKSKNGGSLSSVTLPDNNTTYTFANGTNGFTVTPSGGSAQTVTVTPSITNNVTGTGTSGYLAKFNGTNTITNGPQLGSSTTTFLNNKGEWATPVGTTYSAGDGMTLSTTTFKVNAGTGLTFDTSSPKKLTIAAATGSALGGVKVPASGGLSLSSGSLSINVGSGLKIDSEADNALIIDTSVVTDTKNTAGSTDTSSKIFLIGATSQAANPQTYSHDTCYVGTNGHLYSASKEVLVGGSNASSSVTITPSTTSVYSMSSTGSVTNGTAPSFTRGTFSGGSLSFAMDTTDTRKLKITFTAATHAADTFSAGTTPPVVTLPGRTQVTNLWNGYTAATAAAQTFTGAKS